MVHSYESISLTTPCVQPLNWLSGEIILFLSFSAVNNTTVIDQLIAEIWGHAGIAGT